MEKSHLEYYVLLQLPHFKKNIAEPEKLPKKDNQDDKRALGYTLWGNAKAFGDF